MHLRPVKKNEIGPYKNCLPFVSFASFEFFESFGSFVVKFSLV